MKAKSEVTQHKGVHDQEILGSVWHALRRQPVIRALDLSHITVAVRQTHVYLAGHVSSRRRIEEVVAGVSGVRGLHSELIEDQELAASVALALAADPCTQPYHLRVYADHGWVRVMGEVPSWEVQEAVEAVVAEQPLVRGTLQFPAVANAEEPAGRYRRAVQPPIGAEVFAVEGPPGRVAQVIIDPRNRLVTHMVVETKPVETGPLGAITSNLVVLPIREIQHVARSTVYLRRDSGPLNTYPYFSRADFPAPSPPWRPPFPYERGAVRWQQKVWRRTKRQTPSLYHSKIVEDDFTGEEKSRSIVGAA